MTRVRFAETLCARGAAGWWVRVAEESVCCALRGAEDGVCCVVRCGMLRASVRWAAELSLLQLLRHPPPQTRPGQHSAVKSILSPIPCPAQHRLPSVPLWLARCASSECGSVVLVQRRDARE
eukprot:2839539-Rhodomonas_salina.1